MGRTMRAPREAALVDQDRDELRVEAASAGRFYVSASQGECTATVGPFTREELAALVEVAETTGEARW